MPEVEERTEPAAASEDAVAVADEATPDEAPVTTTVLPWKRSLTAYPPIPFVHRAVRGGSRLVQESSSVPRKGRPR